MKRRKFNEKFFTLLLILVLFMSNTSTLYAKTTDTKTINKQLKSLEKKYNITFTDIKKVKESTNDFLTEEDLLTLENIIIDALESTYENHVYTLTVTTPNSTESLRSTAYNSNTYEWTKLKVVAADPESFLYTQHIKFTYEYYIENNQAYFQSISNITSWLSSSNDLLVITHLSGWTQEGQSATFGSDGRSATVKVWGHKNLGLNIGPFQLAFQIDQDETWTCNVKFSD